MQFFIHLRVNIKWLFLYTDPLIDQTHFVIVNFRTSPTFWSTWTWQNSYYQRKNSQKCWRRRWCNQAGLKNLDMAVTKLWSIFYFYNKEIFTIAHSFYYIFTCRLEIRSNSLYLEKKKVAVISPRMAKEIELPCHLKRSIHHG